MMREKSKRVFDIFVAMIPVISMVVSLCSGLYTWQQSQRYSNNTHQVLMNSATLGLYDVTLMEYKVNTIPTGELNYGQLSVQLDSLEQNLDTIKSIDPTTLPKDDAINYQVYRQDLNTIIKVIQSYVNSMRRNQDTTPVDSEILISDMGSRTNFNGGAHMVQDIFKQDRDALKSDGNLYAVRYAKQLKKLEEDK